MVFQFWYDGTSIGRSLGKIRARRTNFFVYNFKVSLCLIHFNQEKFYELYCFNEFLFFKSIFHFFSSQSKWPFTQEIFNDFWFSDAMYCHHRMLFSHFSKSETEPEKRASPHEQVSVCKNWAVCKTHDMCVYVCCHNCNSVSNFSTIITNSSGNSHKTQQSIKKISKEKKMCSAILTYQESCRNVAENLWKNCNLHM